MCLRSLAFRSHALFITHKLFETTYLEIETGVMELQCVISPPCILLLHKLFENKKLETETGTVATAFEKDHIFILNNINLASTTKTTI